MLTPKRKEWSGWSLSPRVDGPDGGAARSKGKGVAAAGEEAMPPPPSTSPGANGSGKGDWMSFREAGFLDKSRMQLRDREALAERVSDLENELHEYQYNMGLLLIEKKEWSSRFEEMRQGLAAAEEILKREQAAHLNVVSEFEKREENMRRALGVEKQCVADLEKSLREMRAEIAEVKFTSEKKLADAHALEASIEEKHLEIERKLCSADAKLAEASRKSAEIGRKLEDVEARGRKVQRDVLSFNTERKAHEKDLAEHREYLEDWEKKLQDGQRRLVDGQKLLNERENRASELERVLKKKEDGLEEAGRVIENSRNSVKNKEDDISSRLISLAAKEKDVDIKTEKLAQKERDLLTKEENLVARENVGIQKLLDDHALALESKKREFDLEMEQKRKSFEQELKIKVDAVEKEKSGMIRKEEHIGKREQALENKMEKMKLKQKDLDAKSKALKKWEDSVEGDEKKLKEEKKQLELEMHELLTCKSTQDALKSAIETEKQQIINEKENLKLTEEERKQHLQLQSRLKNEIEEYTSLKDSLVKESEALRQEREKFECEWDVLDEKRVALEAELNKVNDEREKFKRWRRSEEERLKNEGLEVRLNIQRELEDLQLKKEKLDSMMEHERLEAHETFKRERADIARELELRKHELEMKIHKKQEDMEKKLQEREAEFDKIREMELGRIKSISSLNESESRKLKMEQDRLEREREQLFTSRKKIEVDQVEIQKDIDTLRMLSRNLKDQRENFMKERDRFLALVEQCKICKNCGVSIGEVDLLGLQLSTETEDLGNVVLPSLADGYMEVRLGGISASPQATDSKTVNSGGRMSWLQKCSKLFNLSPGKKMDNTDGQNEKSFSFGARLEKAASEDEAEHEPASLYGIANDSFNAHRSQFDNAAREDEMSEELVKAGDEPEPSLGITDNLVDIMRNQSDNGIGGREDEPTIPSIGERNEETSVPLENDSEAQASKQRRRQPSRKAKPKTIKRTRSVKAVVEDAKVILAERSKNKDGHPNGDTLDSLNVHDESQGDSVHTNQMAASGRQKRRLSHTEMANSGLDAEDSEVRSESVSIGGRRKRRQTSGPQTPVEKRYNLRRSTIIGTAAATRASCDQAKEVKAGNGLHLHDDEISKDDGNGEPSKHEFTVATSDFLVDNKNTMNKPEKINIQSVSEAQENSSEKVVTFVAKEVHLESEENIVIKSLEFSEQSGEDGDEVDGAAVTEEAAPSDEEYGSEDEDVGFEEDDGDESEKQNASIGKKLWSFFTT